MPRIGEQDQEYISRDRARMACLYAWTAGIAFGSVFVGFLWVMFG